MQFLLKAFMHYWVVVVKKQSLEAREFDSARA